MNINKMKNESWGKNWEFPVSLFSVRTNILGYMSPMKKIFGVSVPQALVISRDGITSCFLVENELNYFSKTLAKKVEGRPSLFKKYLEDYKIIVDRLREEIKKSISELNTKDFNDVQKQILLFASYQVATKEMANYITDKNFILDLEESRKYSETVFFEFVGYLGKILDYISEKTNIERKYLDYITLAEAIGFYEGNKDFSEKDLKKRFSGSGFYVDGKIHNLKSEDIKKIENILYGNTNIKDIKGQIAYKGKVSGKVRVITNYKGVIFNEGDILVTGMTDPRYVPLIKKSAAIVTDAGGLLCHAAIVARELKKPCVIGTKIATKVLKDGDLVEVDANQGIVRILS